MKSEEFAALAKAATPGEWHFNEALSPKYDRDASFWIWCANNRSLIARALRRDEAIENPHTLTTRFTAEKISDVLGFAAYAEIHDAKREGRSASNENMGNAILVAFREAVQ